MEETSIRIVIGAMTVIIGLFACIVLFLWRAGGAKSFGSFFLTLFYMLIFATGFQYLVGSASLWDVIANESWSEIRRPISMFATAIMLTLISTAIWKELKKQSQAPS